MVDSDDGFYLFMRDGGTLWDDLSSTPDFEPLDKEDANG